MAHRSPRMLFNDATPGRERHLQASGAKAVIRADSPQEMAGAFNAIRGFLAQGRVVAGYFNYELGYLLEPRLAPLIPPVRSGPLLWFAAFDRLEEVTTHEDGGRAYIGPLQPEWTADAYRQRFDRVASYIAAGDIYQANLSFRADFAFVGEPLALYQSLMQRSGAAHCAYLDDGSRQILSLSPELFFSLSANGNLTARPMKGTIARGADSSADAQAREKLTGSAKDRAENLMIVDLLRNDLGRIAQVGSVSVENLFSVETYPTLHAMVSTVRAQLAHGTGIEDLVRALFPCGSITGAPKIRAMEILREQESSPRNAYCGAIGYFAPDGSAQFNVAIRTLTIEGGRGSLGVGGGVVQDSTAASEYAECLLKARFFEEGRRPLGLIETLRFEPSSGFARLGSHLNRMENSAQMFSLPFDRTAASGALEDCVAGAKVTQRVRLTLDEAGNFAATASALPSAAQQWTYAISPQRVDSGDMLLRHKTTWREFYDDAAAAAGTDEVLFLNERGELAEGSRSNIFVRRNGQMLTPPLSAGVLDGVLRRELLETRQCREAVLTASDLEHEVFFGNSLRGLIPAVQGRAARALSNAKVSGNTQPPASIKRPL